MRGGCAGHGSLSAQSYQLCIATIDSAIISANARATCGQCHMMSQREIHAEAITLARGANRCELLPLLGGSIGAWTVDGQQMLRTASAASIAARDPFGMASFPLVPYSNRIGNATFEWDGKIIELTPNFPPEPHAIHGVGFERSWTCTARTADSALLTLIHQPDAGWPWPFEARQRITIADRELTLDLTAVN